MPQWLPHSLPIGSEKVRGNRRVDCALAFYKFAFFDLAYCPSNHCGVLVAALHEEPLGNVEDLLDRRLRVLIACHGTSILIVTINIP